MDTKKYESLLPTLGKRPRVVLEHILKNGSVSTYELGQLGYDQPPRAAQDLKEAGVKLNVVFGKHPKTGKRMAIYSLLNEEPQNEVKNGRTAFPKLFKESLFAKHGYRCNICNSVYSSTVLQCDHRVSFILAGEVENLELDKFQPLCAPHQRAKSWECEHCPNRETKDENICKTCFWAIPDGEYTHIATRHERNVNISFKSDEEMILLKALIASAKQNNTSLENEIKQWLMANNNLF